MKAEELAKLLAVVGNYDVEYVEVSRNSNGEFEKWRSCLTGIEIRDKRLF